MQRLCALLCLVTGLMITATTAAADTCNIGPLSMTNIFSSIDCVRKSVAPAKCYADYVENKQPGRDLYASWIRSIMGECPPGTKFDIEKMPNLEANILESFYRYLRQMCYCMQLGPKSRVQCDADALAELKRDLDGFKPRVLAIACVPIPPTTPPPTGTPTIEPLLNGGALNNTP